MLRKLMHFFAFRHHISFVIQICQISSTCLCVGVSKKIICVCVCVWVWFLLSFYYFFDYRINAQISRKIVSVLNAKILIGVCVCKCVFFSNNWKCMWKYSFYSLNAFTKICNFSCFFSIKMLAAAWPVFPSVSSSLHVLASFH